MVKRKVGQNDKRREEYKEVREPHRAGVDIGRNASWERGLTEEPGPRVYQARRVEKEARSDRK